MKNKKNEKNYCENLLDHEYWDHKYKNNLIGWDLGEISPAIKNYINTLEDKSTRILIPGCGNSYEAEYLLKQGFKNITVIDIAPTLVAKLQNKFESNSNIKIVLGDFFEHQSEYDLIIEQTFFCALPPVMRDKYVLKMHQLLSDEGKLVGLLFNKTFESGPPFGGNHREYELLFKNHFNFLNFDLCQYSIQPRANTELFIEFQKK